MNVNIAWETVVTSITPGSLKCAPNDELKEAGDILQNSGLAQIVEEWFLENLKDDLQNSISKKFWSHFSGTAPEVATQNISRAFEELDSSIKLYQPCLLRLQFLKTCFISVKSPIPSLADYIQMLLKASVFFKSTKVFQDAVLQFYTRAFQVFLPSETDVDEPEELCSRCHDSPVDRESCTCADIMSAFHILNQQLNELGLLEWLAGDAITNVIHQKISLHVKHTCSGNFEMNFLDKLEKWLEVKVLGWLNLLYNPQGENTRSTEAEAHVQAQKGRLYHYMYETYAGIRIDELFNIIVEFPESEPALQDLKSCLEKTDLRSKLVTSLKTALETRLLHPGVNTGDILTAYISAIRALRMLDPTGVLLELVCDPVRRYLRCRDDTVRCIVSSLTEDGGNELSDELIKAQPLKMDDSCHSDDDMEDWESWMPDPVDADPGKVSRRSSDIISMLVNIYGSKELFVNEYRTLLADRILSQFNYDTEKEIRYLELLKLRFGESQLHYCEVMLKDVADSRRINQHILEQRKKEEQTEGEIAVNAMILSAQFWPTFREEKLDLPPQLQEALETYTKSYETLKGNRTLNWKPHLGLVDIEIDLKDKTLTFNVSPIHATIIMHFQDKAKWTVEELSSVMHMPTAAIRRKITFWQSQGLLREESTDTFLLVEEQRGKGQGQEVIMMEEEDTESAMASQEDQREEELQVFWSYIVGMLTNLESLPLERIHSILKMFAMQGPSTGEVSLQELKAFLDRKVKEQKLIYAGGVYRLPKAGT